MTEILSETTKTATLADISLLPGHIFYEEKKSGTYGRYVKSTFIKDGKIYHEYENLGRLLDKDAGLFRNRQRGMFTFSLQDGYGNADPQIVPEVYNIPQSIVLNFGDVWMTDQILKQTGLDDILNNLIPHYANTFKTLLCFRLLTSRAYDCAEEWYRNSYSRILYPDVNLDSKAISVFHELIGRETTYVAFFQSYLKMLTKNADISKEISLPILIDSTGLPNDIDTYLTAINNHNGIISEEIRLIYVVDKNSKLPIFFRYVPGNIIDNSTLITTINSLLAYDINIEIVIIDAGYSSLKNIEQLLLAKIPFITRMPKNRKEFKELINTHGHDLRHAENAITCGDRLLYGKKFQITLFGSQLYAYLMLDKKQEIIDERNAFYKYEDDKDKIEKLEKELLKAGKFVIISSEEYDINEILPLYYTRETIEQVFDISKNYADLLPLRGHSEETIRGRLLLSFLTTILYSFISQRLINSKMSANKAIFYMSNLKIKMFESVNLLEELTKEQNDIFQYLNLDCPFSQEKGNQLKKDSHLMRLKKSLQKKGRGRPKGSKNKATDVQSEPAATSELKSKRGRPKGSNK
jgi:hypothetical protein